MDDVPDSTDWLATPLAGLAAVEVAMRCQVCKDFYKTPMITTCSHTFCSICIRRALSNDGKCPLCRAPEQELKLRSNWSMEESVEAFAKARPAALAAARSKSNTLAPCKRKTEGDMTTDSGVSPNMKRIRTSARLNNYRNKDASQISPARKQGNVDEDDENYSEGDGGSDYSPENADSSVPCPSCQKRMKAWQVFKHLEKCPGPLPDSRTNEFLPAERSRQTWQPRVPVTLERLPALNYSILKEQTLRKKLAELGISNQGPRPILERRHKEWITLWNANCDSVLPKKKYQLLQDLDIWEKTQGHRTTPMAKTNSIGVTIKDKNFDGAAWAAKHELSFKNLITNARRGRLEARGPEEDTSSPTEQRAGNHFPHLTHDSTVNFEGADQVPLGLRSEAKQEDLDIASSKSNPMEEVVRLHASSTPVAMSLADVGTLESESPASNSSETHLGGG